VQGLYQPLPPTQVRPDPPAALPAVPDRRRRLDGGGIITRSNLCAPRSLVLGGGASQQVAGRKGSFLALHPVRIPARGEVGGEL